MALNNHASAAFFFGIALILFATANPAAYAINIVSLNVTGTLCCTSTGNCPGGPPITGAVVGLNCTNLLGASVMVGQNVTVNGRFIISVPDLLQLLPNIINLNILQPPCMASVRLPLNETICPILSIVNTTLVGVLRTVDATLSTLLGLRLTANVTAFAPLPR